TEVEASALLLPWSGPRYAASGFFGDSIDEIGQLSPVPIIAAHIVDAEWARVIYFQGRTGNWTVKEEDATLALEVAKRLASQKDIELVVYATDTSEIEDPDDLTVNRYSGRGSQ